MSPQAGFVLHDQIAPRIAGAVARSIQPVGCEDHQELIANGITMAAKMVDRREQQRRPRRSLHHRHQELGLGRGDATLTKLERVLIECLTEDLTVREICRRVNMTKAKLAELQGPVARKVVEVMGAEVLQDIAQIPKWRIGLDCERELMACRSDRRH